MSELNSRQWAVYNLLKSRPDDFITQEFIVHQLHDHYELDHSRPFHDTQARQLLTKDIRAINECPIIQKIIICTSRGVKIANKEEFERYISREFASIFRKLARTRQKARKAGLDKQMLLVLGEHQRDTIEAFADSINRLKAARQRAGLRLADVVRDLAAAGETGIDVPLLSKMERGLCQPTESVLLKLAAIYGAEPFDLLGDNVAGIDTETA